MYMKLKGIYNSGTATLQISILLSFVLTGAILSGAFQIVLYPVLPGSPEDKLRVLQTIASICLFFLPAVGSAYLFSEHITSFLSLKKSNTKMALLAIVSIIALSPAINITTVINQQITFPAFMEPIETWMKAQETEMNQLTKQLLAEPGIAPLLFNLFVIAVIASITEEFLFRGTFQRIVEKWSKNHHIVIWTTAFIFSAVHIQFYGLIPRMLLGAYLGYLLYWSQSIYIPIVAHFANNAVGVIIMSNASLSESKLFSEQTSLSDTLLPGFAGLSLFILFVLLIKSNIPVKQTKSEL